MAATEQYLDTKFVLRLPGTLHKAIKKSARANERSMNRHIVTLLKDSLGRRVSQTTVLKAMKGIAAQLESLGATDASNPKIVQG